MRARGERKAFLQQTSLLSASDKLEPRHASLHFTSLHTRAHHGHRARRSPKQTTRTVERHHTSRFGPRPITHDTPRHNTRGGRVAASRSDQVRSERSDRIRSSRSRPPPRRSALSASPSSLALLDRPRRLSARALARRHRTVSHPALRPLRRMPPRRPPFPRTTVAAATNDGSFLRRRLSQRPLRRPSRRAPSLRRRQVRQSPPPLVACPRRRVTAPTKWQFRSAAAVDWPDPVNR